MIVKNQKISIKWNNASKRHYIDKGYCFTKIGETFEANVEDLPTHSSIKVLVVCDYCGCEYYTSYKNYLKCLKNGKSCCRKCSPSVSRQTMIDRYGAAHYQQTEECKRRKIKTFIEKYGVENPSQLEEIQEKKKRTNLEKYGTEWYTQSEDFIKMSNKKYGKDNPMQCLSVQEKAVETLYKNGLCPTSKEEEKLVCLLESIYGKENCNRSHSFGRFIMDCLLTINDVFIDVEYDGFYWHKTRENYDRKRDEVLKKNGYKILRIVSNGDMPSIEQIKEAVDYLSTTQNKFTRINLV